MSLTEYRQKRNFTVTGEPRGGTRRGRTSLSFVVQKHAASHLHYDFRLELDGVLLSWAVPKGPSLDPATKRLAMHVEDHPLEYGDFEGTIPQGEYGGGSVLLWDKGTWEPIDDAKKSYGSGALKFTLHGKKLKGRWMLVRKGGKRGSNQEKTWFLFKEKDEFAAPDNEITASEPLSVTTGRSLEEIAAASDRVWGKNGELKPPAQTRRPSRSTMKDSANGHVPVKSRAKKQHKLSAREQTAIKKTLSSFGKKSASMPRSIKVQLATLVSDAPATDDWLHEIKLDGYRMICRVSDGKAELISRNGKDWTARFGDLATDLAMLPVKNAIIDGEVVLFDSEGRTTFQLLQNAFKSKTPAPFVFCAFDLLFLNGFDVAAAPLEERKKLLRRIIPKDSDAVKYSDHVVGNGPAIFAEASKLKLEGIISKRRGQPYLPGRGPDWLKVKCSLREEFVIGGFTKPTGRREHFGAILLGFYDKAKNLIYAGRVGTGFDDRTLASLRKQFSGHIQSKSPFTNLSGTTGQARGVTWLKPTLVAQVEFSNWTDDRQLRHPSFQGLREDKAARSVIKDDPVSVETLASAEQTSGTKTSRGRRRPSSMSHTNTNSATAEVAGVQLTHPDKLLYSQDGITKLDLVHYYEKVATWILPHVSNRLLSLVRCPEGSAKKCFFQKHPVQGLSDHLRRFDVREKNETEEYLALYDLAGLISLVQMGVLEIHIWGSQADRYEKPDRLIFDLDPDPSVKWPEVVAAAKEVKLLLETIELESFVKTTGGKGLHVVVPIQRRTSWNDAKEFCRSVADFMVAAAPDRYIATMSKAARKGKIFVDYLRNDQGSTAIAPFSTRAKPGATVSVPITWDELTARLTSDHFNIGNLPHRLEKLKKDPWAGIDAVKQSIKASMLTVLKQR